MVNLNMHMTDESDDFSALNALSEYTKSIFSGMLIAGDVYRLLLSVSFPHK